MASAEDRAAIADLVHAYALAVRRDRVEDLPALFTADGWFEIRDGHPSKLEFTVRKRLDSPAALLAYVRASAGQPHPVPLIHNLMIEVSGDIATSSAMMEARVIGTAMTIQGEYADTFARQDGRWRFASRVFTIFPYP